MRIRTTQLWTGFAPRQLEKVHETCGSFIGFDGARLPLVEVTVRCPHGGHAEVRVGDCLRCWHLVQVEPLGDDAVSLRCLATAADPVVHHAVPVDESWAVPAGVSAVFARAHAAALGAPCALMVRDGELVGLVANDLKVVGEEGPWPPQAVGPSARLGAAIEAFERVETRLLLVVDELGEVTHVLSRRQLVALGLLPRG